jgi:hypothetical protein
MWLSHSQIYAPSFMEQNSFKIYSATYVPCAPETVIPRADKASPTK